jgi:hypothetical protein
MRIPAENTRNGSQTTHKPTIAAINSPRFDRLAATGHPSTTIRASGASDTVSQLVEIGSVPQMLKVEVVVQKRDALPVAEEVAVSSQCQFPYGASSERLRPDPVAGRLCGPREYQSGREVIRRGDSSRSVQSGLNFFESFFALSRAQEKLCLFDFQTHSLACGRVLARSCEIAHRIRELLELFTDGAAQLVNDTRDVSRPGIGSEKCWLRREMGDGFRQPLVRAAVSVLDWCSSPGW